MPPARGGCLILGNPCLLGFTQIPGRSKSLQKLVSERGQASRLEWQKLVACLPAETVSGEHPENQKSPNQAGRRLPGLRGVLSIFLVIRRLRRGPEHIAGQPSSPLDPRLSSHPEVIHLHWWGGV